MRSGDPFSAPVSFKWCALSTETAKCAEFISYVVKMTAALNSSQPRVDAECVNAATSEECIGKIKSGSADLVTLDGGDVYTAGKLWILASMIVL